MCNMAALLACVGAKVKKGRLERGACRGKAGAEGSDDSEGSAAKKRCKEGLKEASRVRRGWHGQPRRNS
jgi:hypothetical protein